MAVHDCGVTWFARKIPIRLSRRGAVAFLAFFLVGWLTDGPNAVRPPAACVWSQMSCALLS
jgi:hypothetical protein